jgi:hypothetical protein
MKPKHKFNSGNGATLCNKCNKIITEGLTDNLLCEDCGGTEPMYILVRERDGLTKTGNSIIWIQFDEDGKFESKHDDIAIGRNLVLDFSGITYTWLTTTINEIMEQREDYIKFKTENSIYELFINKTDD